MITNLQSFWSNAICYYFVDNKPPGSIVFISLSRDLLSDIAQSFLKSIKDEDERKRLNNLYVSQESDVEKSYLKAATFLAVNYDPNQYQFLYFSFYTYIAFLLESRNGYWEQYESVISEYGHGKKYKYTDAKNNLKKTIDKLTNTCIAKEKFFFNVNIYELENGRNNRKFVGRIYSHAIFQGKSLTEIKKFFYLSGLYRMPVSELDDEIVSKILIKAGLHREVKLFDDFPELVVETLRLLLHDWYPAHNEIEQLFGTNKNNTPKQEANSSSLVLKQLWKLKLNNDNSGQFFVYSGFTWRKTLGREGKIVLNEQEGVYVDLDQSPGYLESWGNSVYVLNKYVEDSGLSLNNEDWDLNFKLKGIRNGEKFPASLKSVAGSKFYYLVRDNRVTFSNDKVIHVTTKELSLKDYNSLIHLSNLEVEGAKQSLHFYLVKEGGQVEGITYIHFKHSLNIKLSGVGDGISGSRSFLRQFPITISGYSPADGKLQLFDNKGVLVKEFSHEGNAILDNVIIKLDNSGLYKMKVKGVNGEFEHFKNGKDYLEFELNEHGNQVNRTQDLLVSKYLEYSFSKYNTHIKVSSLVDKWKIFYHNNWQVDFLLHHFFDFIIGSDFKKVIVSQDKLFITSIPCSKVHRIRNIKEYNSLDFPARYYKYITTGGKLLEFNARPIYQGVISLGANREWFNYDLILPSSRYVFLNVVRFQLTEVSPALKDKYPKRLDEVLLLTNFQDMNNPELLLQELCQESFPFKNRNV